MKKTKFLLKSLFILVIILLITGSATYLYLRSLPKLEISNINSISIYDNKKQLVFQGNENKKWTSLNNVSKYAIDSTIYTEDKRFYKHHGFDILSIMRAFLINIRMAKTTQGASTITQQYAKNLFLDFDKTWKRKWQEMWYTMRIEKDYSKKQILEGYLNTINYGHGMYGIEAASKFYFNKSAKDLDLAEASMITGIPKSPSNYSPLVDFKTAKKRQLLVLKSLVRNNIITKKEKEDAYNEELNIIGSKDNDEVTSFMYYHDTVLNELEHISSIPKSLIDTKGLKIYTTFDKEAQQSLDTSLKEAIPEESEIESSVVMMKPKNGSIIALAGGRDYNKSSYNRVVSSSRQVGSTMKPFLYYAALENGFTSSTTFTSEKTTFTFDNNLKYTPKNYNDKYGEKPITMAMAVAYSDNVYAVKTHLFLGEDSLINLAKRVGITAKLEKIPSLPLGTNEINIIDMATGYSAFASLGYKVTPHLITKVEDKDGNVLYEYEEDRKIVLNKSLCFILNNILTATYDKDFIDYNYPTAVGIAPKMTHKYALKSGTTDTDNWHIGFNKDILTAVWVGYDDNKYIQTSEYKYSQNIWLNTMERYLKDKNPTWYKVPNNVSEVLVDPLTGKPSKDTDTRKKIMYFIKGTEPTDTNTVFDEKIGESVAS